MTKPTMAEVWEELDQTERSVIAKMLGVEVGQLALYNIANVLKAVAYRYHDRPQVPQPTEEYIRQIEEARQRMQYELQMQRIQQEREMLTRAKYAPTHPILSDYEFK